MQGMQSPAHHTDAASDRDALATLLVAAQDGRPGALDRLIVACRPVITRHARRCAWRPSDVDDVVQDVWIRLVEHVGEIREPHAFVGWLRTVTARSASEIGRRSIRFVPTPLDDERPGSASTEEQAVSAHERSVVVDAVRAALARLDDDDRQLLLLLHRSDAPCYREVSRQVSRPIGSLGPTRQRLLHRLRTDPAVRRLQPVS